jgi:hypothetical protein
MRDDQEGREALELYAEMLKQVTEVTKSSNKTK